MPLLWIQAGICPQTWGGVGGREGGWRKWASVHIVDGQPQSSFLLHHLGVLQVQLGFLGILNSNCPYTMLMHHPGLELACLQWAVQEHASLSPLLPVFRTSLQIWLEWEQEKLADRRFPQMEVRSLQNSCACRCMLKKENLVKGKLLKSCKGCRRTRFRRGDVGRAWLQGMKPLLGNNLTKQIVLS